MLLAVDAGNTQTVYGVFDGERLAEHYRVATERRRTADELYVLINGLLDLDAVDGVCLSSTVPALVREYEEFAGRAGLPALVMGPGVSTGMAIRYGLDNANLESLRGLTIVPALTAGIEDRVGSLEVGKDADILALTGDVGDPRTSVERVWIGGKSVYDTRTEERRW